MAVARSGRCNVYARLGLMVAPITTAFPKIPDEKKRLNIIAHLRLILSDLGANAPDFTPLFIQALKQDSSVFVRLQAAEALGQFARSPETAVPALADIQDREALVRLATLDALSDFGSNGLPATPRLQQWTKDKDSRVSAKANALLRKLGTN